MKSERAYVMTERARSTQETGERILDATIALFAELPYAQLTLRAVAERADVTVQTVIRRFGDKEGLTVAAAARSRGHVSAQRSTAPVGDLLGAVDNLVTHYEEAGDLALRLLSEEQSSRQLAALAELGRTLHREWCACVFAPTLGRLRGADRARRAAQLVAICDVYTWKLLRRDAGLSQRQVATALIEMLEPLTAKG
jgi:AcrR family transcriptional regulator